LVGQSTAPNPRHPRPSVGRTLARALWPVERERPRARTLAADARAAFLAAGRAADVADVDAWLRAR